MVTQQNVPHVRPSCIKDVAIVADNLRKEDAAECKAHSGSSPRESLLYCYFMSKPCMTIVSAKGNPLGLGNPLIDPKDKEQIRLDKILNNEV